ncbi:MAG: cobalt ECF transporter T component CbiQ [Thermoguttaceae bacterium]|nr:cobalt ECF transporter T component CbiQ [Thermoguttaceae bacterium]
MIASLFRAATRIRTLELQADRDTFIHHLHPLVKMAVTLLFLVFVISFDRYQISPLIPFFLYPVGLAILSETKIRPIMISLLTVLPFVLFIGISNMVLDRQLAFTVGRIPISYGMISSVSILLKTILTVSAVLLLISTAPVSVLAEQLTRLKIPSILVLQLMLTYRYIAVLFEEASSMVIAYTLRSPRKRGIAMRDMGVFLGNLLLRSMDRADRIYHAMKCRGFHGKYHTRFLTRWCWKDFLFAGFCGLTLCFFRMVHISLWLEQLTGGLR